MRIKLLLFLLAGVCMVKKNVLEATKQEGQSHITIRLLQQDDVEIVKHFISLHQSYCMFLASNLDKGGIVYQEALYQGEYWGCFDQNSGQLHALYAQYWNGNGVVFADGSQELDYVVRAIKEKSSRLLRGLLGPDVQVAYILNQLGLSNESYKINHSQTLYALDLHDVKEIDIPLSYSVVKAKEIDTNIMIEWMQEYEHEVVGFDKNYERAVEKATFVCAGDAWVLLQNTIPISLSAFNARTNDMVQIGPVWTPVQYRRQGFARLLLQYSLLQAKKEGIRKAILFTGNPDAIALYESMGFKEIGSYRLAFFKNSIQFRK